MLTGAKYADGVILCRRITRCLLEGRFKRGKMDIGVYTQTYSRQT